MSNQQVGSDSTAGMSTSLTFSHHWTVDNFVYLYDEKCQWKWRVQSEEFSVPENEELKFSLIIWPKEKGEDGEEYLGVGLCTQEIPAMWEGKVTVEWRCSIVDEEGKKLWEEEYAEREVFKNRWRGDVEYLSVKKLLDPSADYLKRGMLRVLYEMTLYSPEAIFTSPHNPHTFSHTSIPTSVSSLSHSLTLSHFKWLCEDRTRQMPLRVESDYFDPQREDIGKMKIEFYPKGWEGKDEENVGIAICNQNTDCLLLHWECFLLDAKDVKCHQDEDTYRFPPNNGRFHSFPRRTVLSLLDSLPTDELTINCHVTVLGTGGQEKAPSSPTTPTTTTHLDFALFTFHYVPFTWTIEQFLEKLKIYFINSKVFSPSTDSPYSFNLRLYPKKDKEKVTLELGFVSPSFIEESTVDCRYSVVDKKENEWKVGTGTTFLSKRTKLASHKLISHRTLSNFASHLLPEGKLTIKCELWIHEKKAPEITESMNSTASKSTCLTFSHHWTINNFSHLYDETCQWKWRVQSEEFSVPENEDLKFSLSIWPKVKGKDGEEYLAVGLSTEEIPSMWEGKVTVEVRRCIVDEEGSELFNIVCAEYEVFKDRWTGDDEYLPVEKLLDPSAGYLKGGILRVLYELTLNSPEAIFTSPDNPHTFSYTSIPSSVSSLSHSFTLSHFKWLCEDSTRQMPLRVESEYFAPQREDIGKMRIHFYPKGREGNDEEKVEIAIRNENTDCLFVHYAFFLLNAKGEICHPDVGTIRIQPKSGEFHSLPRRHLLSLLDSLPTDKLTINCLVTVLGKGKQDGAHSLTPTTTTTTTHLDFALSTFHYVPFTWTIERFLEQRHRQSKEKVSLSLAFLSTSLIEASTVNCRFSVVDTKEDEWNVRVRSYLISKNTQFGHCNLIRHCNFIPHRTSFASLLLPEGKLTIKCELWIHEPRKELPPELRNPSSAQASVASLSSGVTQVSISHSQISNTNIVANSAFKANDITQNAGNNSAEP